MSIKFMVVCLMILVACAILITTIALQSIDIKIVQKKKFEPSKTLRQCKPAKQIESVNWNSFYYYEDRKSKNSIIWCKVPKVGSTSLTKLFLRLAGAKNIQNNTRIHKMLREFYPRLSVQSMKQKLHTSKSFMVVRDPFERILSAYRDKLESYQRDLLFRDGFYYEHYGKYMVNNPAQEIPITNSSNNRDVKPIRKEPTWREFVNYLIRTSVGRYDEHWMPISRLCSPCNVKYTAVIKLENLKDDIKPTLQHVGIQASNIGWAHRTGTSNKKIIASYFNNLTIGEVKKLYTKYKRDFQIFGYTPFKYYKMANKETTIQKKL